MASSASLSLFCWAYCSTIYIIDYPTDVEVDDGLAAGGGFKESEVLRVVVEKVLAKCIGARVFFRM